MRSWTLHTHASMGEIPAIAWDALLPPNQPLMQHAFLHALETSGSIRRELGWQPHHLTLRDDHGDILAAAPCYLKTNSHGEFVFDHRWAYAHEQSIGAYYPKLLVGVPYSPVTGARILAQDDDAKSAMLDALPQLCEAMQLSSVHINFVPEALTELAAKHPQWLVREDDQFHWHRRGAQSFDDFLEQLRAKKRKAIRHERRDVTVAGITCVRKTGDMMDAADLDFIHACYQRTMTEKGNTPVLTRDFFATLQASMPQHIMAVLAYRAERPIAMAFFFVSDTHVYGRYWGAVEEVRGLHFECCYYQGIEFCVERGIDTFEPGAGGEHKVARGFVPQPTCSLHHLRHAGFAEAVREALHEERTWVLQYRQQVMAHSPFKERDDDKKPGNHTDALS